MKSKMGLSVFFLLGSHVFASNAVEVGSYLTASNNVAPLSYVSTNKGATWALSLSFILPQDVAATGIQNNQLLGVTCEGVNLRCSAVGFYFTNQNNIAPLTYTSTNGGASWALSSSLPLPRDVAANGAQKTQLQGVSCDSTGRLCRGVGFYRNQGNNLLPLGYVSADGGGTWSLSNPFSLPSDVAANGIQTSELKSVNCNSTGMYCSAVGFYLNKGNNLVPLSYTSQNGGITWLLNVAMQPPGNNAGSGYQKNILLSVG